MNFGRSMTGISVRTKYGDAATWRSNGIVLLISE